MHMTEFMDKVVGIATTVGAKILLAIVAFIIGRIIIKAIGKALDKIRGFSKLDQTVQSFIHSLVRIGLNMVLIIAIIQILGIPMTSVITVLASAGLAIGLSLQGALSNCAGGLMILIFKPFKVGNYIESTGAEGIVQDISIFYTTLTTLDNKKVFVPNGDLMNANITNYTANDIRRVDQDFKITNDIDAEFVKRVLLEAAKATPGVLADPEPFARMTDVDDDTYLFTVRVWCNTADYWDVKFDMVETCSKALADNSIDDPEERIAVRLVKDED